MMRVEERSAPARRRTSHRVSPHVHTWIRANVHTSWWSALLFILYILYQLNFRDLGDPFSPTIPQDEWFLHLYQWGPDGCGTELCR